MSFLSVVQSSCSRSSVGRGCLRRGRGRVECGCCLFLVFGVKGVAKSPCFVSLVSAPSPRGGLHKARPGRFSELDAANLSIISLMRKPRPPFKAAGPHATPYICTRVRARARGTDYRERTSPVRAGCAMGSLAAPRVCLRLTRGSRCWTPMGSSLCGGLSAGSPLAHPRL